MTQAKQVIEQSCICLSDTNAEDSLVSRTKIAVMWVGKLMGWGFNHTLCYVFEIISSNKPYGKLTG